MDLKNTLNDLKEKLRKKYWELKDTPERDWKHKLLILEIESLRKRIDYLNWRMSVVSDYPYNP
jgi:hypothetical protein